MSSYTPSPVMKLFNRKTLLTILVIGLIAAPVAFFFFSYHSVDGTTVELAKVLRSLRPGLATFQVEAHVWSWAGSLETHVNALTFNLAVDGYSLGTATVPGGSFQPHRYLSYNLRFQTADYDVARAVDERDSNNVVITMTALVNAGMYGQMITRSDSAMWKWAS